MTTAAQSMTAHAKARCAERYHVSLNRTAYWQLVRRIQDNDADLLMRVSCTRTVWRVAGMVAVYSSRFHRIVTFLPRDCWEGKVNNGSNE